MSQQEVIQFMNEHYDYNKDKRTIKINDNEYRLHITKTNFEFHNERDEEDSEYINHVVVKEDIHVEVIRSFNFKDIHSYDILRDCVIVALKM